MGWFLSQDEYLLVLELILVIRSLDLSLDSVLYLGFRLRCLVSILVEYGRWEA